MSRTVQVDGEALAVSARKGEGPGRWVVTLGDRAVAVRARLSGDGTLLVTPDGGAPFRATVTREGVDAWVSVGGRTVRILEATRSAGHGTGHGGGLEAPMPGKVMRVICAPGDAVTQGETLVVVEAMKMEHAVKSPRDGVVAEVRVEQGALVSPGQPLVVLEER